MSEVEPKAESGELTAAELRDAWPWLSAEERAEGVQLLGRQGTEDFFLSGDTSTQAGLLLGLPPAERRSWMRLLPLDDAADLIQEVDPAEREGLLALLEDASRKEVVALLAYAEDDAGGLMNPHFARVRPDMTVDQAISYLRKQARDRLEATYYVYVCESDQRLLGVVSFRGLFLAPSDRLVRDIMQQELVTVPEQMDQEVLSRLFAEHDLLAIPVVDSSGRMKGIVTVDDIVDVVAEEATEDVHKFGGLEALEQPYMAVDFLTMVKKRARWLAALFLGEMLTTAAMTEFEDAIKRAVVLALFVPLIISSGGNSGSQASTLVIRAMALAEIRLKDWWRVARRELASGLALGGILGVIGFLRIVGWELAFHSYGPQYVRIGLIVAFSLVGVVTFGTLSGSLLPFLLHRLGADPASASAPFVATLVDVSGVLIYFGLAALLLGGVAG